MKIDANKCILIVLSEQKNSVIFYDFHVADLKVTSKMRHADDLFPNIKDAFG